MTTEQTIAVLRDVDNYLRRRECLCYGVSECERCALLLDIEMASRGEHEQQPTDSVAQRACLRLQISKLAIAHRQIAWLADAEQPLSVKAAQIASDALASLGEY